MTMKGLAKAMGQAMVAITEEDCTGCDLCIPFCPFEALLPLAVNTRGKGKRPVIVVEKSCVGCLSCIGSCPTGALFEIPIPIDSKASPLMNPSSQYLTEIVERFSKQAISWPKPKK
jgi:NAD-dependent dihydropyrimidine dehydrogenase PreA subunit